MEKLSLFRLTFLTILMVFIDVNVNSSVLEDKLPLKMLELPFSSKLDWSSYIVTTAKTASMKIGDLIRSMKIFSPEVILYLHKSTIQMEYCAGPLVATWHAR